jgi:outer membrane protein assembly factor BamD (BamD/ComL family)
MQKLRWVTILMLMTGLMMTACSDGARDIFDTAELEELQNSPERALILYQEIVDKYPSSPLAKKAKERIKALKKSR